MIDNKVTNTIVSIVLRQSKPFNVNKIYNSLQKQFHNILSEADILSHINKCLDFLSRQNLIQWINDLIYPINSGDNIVM